MPNATGLSEEVRREVGQHFVVGWPGKTVDEHITTLIRDYYVGSVIIFKRNIESFEQIKDLIDQLQQLAKDAGHERPLMIGIDQENGLVSAFNPLNGLCGTQFPGAMALAATGSPELAKETSAAAARELRAAGVTWVYSPVCDVNSDPRNPVIGVRSYGDDSNQVATFAAAVAGGLIAARIAPSLKHFPGHGDTHVDSHAALPVIRKTRADLLATELPPFSALVELGLAPTIMTGHMALPLLDPDAADPNLPCSLSRAVTTDLLRGELGFEGVVVTDCLEMDAVRATYGCPEAAVRALEAGADIAMICHQLDRQAGALEAVYTALSSGRLNSRALAISGERVASLKDRFAYRQPDVAAVDWAALKAEHEALSAAAYNRVVAAHANQSVLPLSRSGIVVVTPEMASLNPAVDAPPEDGVLRTKDGALRNTAGPSYLALAQALGATSHIVANPRSSIPTAELEHAQSVVFATRNASDAGSAWQLDRLAEVVAAAGPEVKIVVVSTCTPYDLIGIARVAPRAAHLATFEFTAAAMQAAARVIFGEVQASGRVPVRLGEVRYAPSG